MHLQIIVFGKTTESFFQASQQHYLKRIAPFAKIDWCELKEEKIVDNASIEQIKEKEAKRFFEKYAPKHFLIACDVQGKHFSSQQFAEMFEKTKQYAPGITIVIGGALGLAQSILQKADVRLSLSANTFPHDLFRTMLLEQVYRAFMIIAKREYHK